MSVRKCPTTAKPKAVNHTQKIPAVTCPPGNGAVVKLRRREKKPFDWLYFPFHVRKQKVWGIGISTLLVVLIKQGFSGVKKTPSILIGEHLQGEDVPFRWLNIEENCRSYLKTKTTLLSGCAIQSFLYYINTELPESLWR